MLIPMAADIGFEGVARDPRQGPPRSPRVFYAVELPAPIRARLGRTADEVRRVLPGLRPVAPEDLHLTLVFLGEVDPAAAVASAIRVRERLSAFAPFSFSLVGLGAFPDPGHARVLWCGVSDAGPLAALAGMVAEASGDASPEGERRFRAHVSVGRFRRTPDRDVLAEVIAGHAGRDLGRVETRGFVLHQSRCDGGLPRYRELARFELEAGP
jgi:2'-5' RNA ligase